MPTSEPGITVVYRYVGPPESLTEPIYATGATKTYGDAVDLALNALGALDQCNDDKLKIRELENVEHD